MDASDQREVFEMSWKRVSYPGGWNYLRTSVIVAFSGVICGTAITNVLYMHMTFARAKKLTGWLVAAMAASQLALLVYEFVRLRMRRKELIEDREELLANAKAELQRAFPNDPVHVARMLMKFQEMTKL